MATLNGFVLLRTTS